MHRKPRLCGEPADLHVTSHRAAYEPRLDGVWLQVGATAHGLPHVLTPAAVFEAVQGDPLVLRLALVGRRYRAPIDLSRAEIADAGHTLLRWRRQVAEWAGYPPRPMPADVVQQAHAAARDDLNMPAVLDVLRHLEACDEIAPGSKFEGFVHLDQLLALDLTRSIGRDHSDAITFNGGAS